MRSSRKSAGSAPEGLAERTEAECRRSLGSGGLMRRVEIAGSGSTTVVDASRAAKDLFMGLVDLA